VTLLAGRRAAQWLLLGLAWLAAIGGLSWWLAAWQPADLREALKSLQFWNVEAIVWGVVATSAAAVPRLWKAARQRDVPLASVVGASLLAFTLAALAAPETNRIYFDEQIYQHIGQNLSDLRLAQMCNDGSVEYGILRCFRGEYNKQPTGYPHLLGLVYRLFGVREAWAFWLNPLCLAALVVVVALATALLFEDRLAPGFAALIMALIPEQLRWSHTAASEPSSALMCAVAILAVLLFVRDRSTTALAWAVATAAFAVQFRLESLLCLPIAAAILVVLARDELRQPRLWVAALAGFLLCGVLLGHIAAVRDEPWGASGARMALAYIAPNFAVNGPFYVADWRFPLLYTLCAVTGLVVGRSLWPRVIALAYFVAFWGVYLVFYAGSYNYGADVRYSLMTYPPLAMLGGVGLSAITHVCRRRIRLPFPAAATVAAIVVGQFLLYMPYVRAVGEEAWSARADVEAAQAFRLAVPPDGVVLTHTPSMFLLWGTNALQASIATTEPDASKRLAIQYPGGVFLHWGFWCNVNDAVQAKFCTDALTRFPGQLLLEQRRQSSRFALYRLF
jgi:4-amino-4-deoxy-L-arabinose transferase-like glycosyltransferase